jgi:hypothetical protein
MPFRDVAQESNFTAQMLAGTCFFNRSDVQPSISAFTDPICSPNGTQVGLSIVRLDWQRSCAFPYIVKFARVTRFTREKNRQVAPLHVTWFCKPVLS